MNKFINQINQEAKEINTTIKKEFNQLKPLVNGFCKGITIGVFLSVFLSLAFAKGHYAVVNPNNTHFQYLLSISNEAIANGIIFFLWGIIGICMEYANKIFEQEYGLLKATALHFLAIYIPVAFTGFTFGGWFVTWGEFIRFNLFFITVYAIIYLIMYFKMKKNIEELNQINKQKIITK